MAGIKYAPRPYEETVTVLERVEYFNYWFWANHEDIDSLSTKLGISTNKLNRILTLEQLPDEKLLKEMVELCNIK